LKHQCKYAPDKREAETNHWHRERRNDFPHHRAQASSAKVTHRKGIADPKTGAYPSLEEAIQLGYALVGTVDTVTRTLEKIRRHVPIDWLFCYTYNSLVPHAVLMKSIERFWTQVMPRVS